MEGKTRRKRQDVKGEGRNIQRRKATRSSCAQGGLKTAPRELPQRTRGEKNSAGGQNQRTQNKRTMEQLTLQIDNDEKLFEEIASERQLRSAFRAVKANRGAPGVDGVSVENFELYLDEEVFKLAEELREWRYEVQPVRRVRIPKPDGGERLLGVPTVRDRVVQCSIKMALEARFEQCFSESSFGFRPGRSQREALAQAKRLVNDGKRWVVDIDLEKFFDHMNHDQVLNRVRRKVKDKRVIRVIGMTLRSGVLDGMEYEPSDKGSPQGSPLSPLLSNILLDELDKELERRGLNFCRFADDCNIFTGSKKAAERVMSSVTKFIERRLGLKVNKEKSKVGLADTVKFLGMTIRGGLLTVSRKAFNRAMSTVRELTPRRTHVPWEEQIAKINQWYRGWSEYFGQTELPSQLRQIEEHIRRRMRAQIVRNQKKRRTLYQRLRRKGARASVARQVFNSHGNWWLSHCSAVEQVWSVRWFQAEGLLVVSNQERTHWQPPALWIKFV